MKITTRLLRGFIIVLASLTINYASIAADTTTATNKKTAPVKQESKSSLKSKKIDINTATQAELETLPGIGQARAKRIIEGRPYSAVSDLSKAGVPSATIQKLTPLVSAGKSGKITEAAGAKTSAKAAADKGMVWANPETKVFHQPGDRWYGKTKQGAYMTEKEALSAGYRESKQSPAKQQK